MQLRIRIFKLNFYILNFSPRYICRTLESLIKSSADPEIKTFPSAMTVELVQHYPLTN